MIRSVYFDDYSETAYYDKQSGVENRIKLRLRIYPPDYENVKLELKEKRGGFQQKHTLLIRRSEAEALIDKDYDFNYSNFGISTLGLVLEKVYDKNYYELLEEYFKELGMNNTSVAIGKGNLSGYWKWNEDDGYIPTGAIISNIEDMSKYLETLITSDESYIIKTQEPLTDVRAVNDIYNMFDINVDKVGMTWMIDNKNDIIWHNGSTTNFNSYIGYNKEKKVGVVVLSNISLKSDVNMTFIGNKILHEMLDK